MTEETWMFIATSQEMQNIDRRAGEEFGIPSLLLMENAAIGVTRILEEIYGPVKGKNIPIVCGKGIGGAQRRAAPSVPRSGGERALDSEHSEQTALKGD